MGARHTTVSRGIHILRLGVEENFVNKYLVVLQNLIILIRFVTYIQHVSA